jgi:hypothetical protein
VQWINKFLNYILIVSFAACAGVFGYIYLQPPTNQAARPVDRPQFTNEELVNKYIKQGALQIQQQKFDSLKAIKSVDTSSVTNKKSGLKSANELPTSEIPIEKQIAKDSENFDQQSLEEQFNLRAYQKQQQNIQDQQAKKAYAKEFIENARKEGYRITLSEDLEVTSVKPLRQPTNEQDQVDVFEAEPSN